MLQETGVQSQVESYQRLKKWYLILPCLTLSIIRYESRVKWSNPRNGVVHPLHLGVVAIEKGAFGLPLTTVVNFTYLERMIYSYKHRYVCMYVWIPQNTELILAKWLECSPMTQETGFNPRTSDTKESKNGAWYLFA